MRGVLIGLAAVLVGAVSFADPAAAAPRITGLTIKVKSSAGPARVAWLTCRPAAGTHPYAAAACAALEEADGDPSRIPADEGMCTMEYAPVTLTVRGRWEGRTVDYRKTHSNRCEMLLATGPLGRL